MSSGVVTPEAVLLELPTAGIAARVFARLIDLLLQAAFLLAASMLAVFALPPSVSPVLLAIVLSFTTLLVLPIATEVLWRGRSPGKAALGLRVVGADGAPEMPRQALVRGLVALVDLYLSLGSVALVTALFSPTTQRSGDMAAGTAVIRMRSMRRTVVPIAFHPPPGYEAYVWSLDVGALDDEDFSLIRETLLRAGQLDDAHRAQVMVDLASTVAGHIRHSPPSHVDAETWLVCVASAYQLRSGGLLADAAAGLAPLAAPQDPAAPRRR
jgi:uncharacterized RDD family membrane protein YckC